ncbi:MAG TPA: alpha/beta fold hydrolase [Pirellulales bacterium]|nr:alpha/beta fold hydrolase [Pirellulales bacterium]
MRRISVGEAQFNVYERGAGPAVVFLHGFPLSHSMWMRQLDELGATNRLVAPDLRGFGRSTVTDGKVTMAQMADDVAGILDCMNIRQSVCLCGLSMGGYVAFEFWRRHRDRVRSMILCDTRSLPDTPEAAAGRHQTADRVLADGAGVVAEAMLPKLLGPRTRAEQPLVAEAVREMILATDPHGIAAALRGMAERADSTDLLSKITVRTLVLVGQEDAISPPDEMRKLAGGIPQAQFTVIPGAGHMSPLENSSAVNGAIAAFLANELHAR